MVAECSYEGCGLRFSDNYALDIHIRRKHTQEKPFKCDSCDYTAVCVNAVNTHKKIHNKPSFACELCDKVYTSKKCLINHIKKHDGVAEIKQKLFKCKYCDFETSVHAEKLEHSKLHIFTCGECKKIFKFRSPYAKHMDYHKRTNLLFDEICSKVKEGLERLNKSHQL